MWPFSVVVAPGVVIRKSILKQIKVVFLAMPSKLKAIVVNAAVHFS